MIAFITAQPSAGAGSENLWAESAIELADRGLLVSAFVPVKWRGSKAADDLREKGVRLEFFQGETGLGRRLLARLLNVFPDTQRKVRSGGGLSSHPTLRAAKLIVVNQGGLFDVSFIPGLRLLLEQYKIPYVLNVRSGRGLPGIISYDHRIRIRRLFEGARAIVLPTMANVRDIENELCFRPRNVRAIHSPIKNLHHEVPPWPVNPKVSFASVCRYEVHEKGLDLIVAAAGLLAVSGKEFRVSLYGKGPDSDYLADLIRFHKVEDKVKIVGPYHDLHEVWSQHHVCLAASRSEGLPQSLMEAMMAGRPAVVTAVGGMPELVLPGESGYLCAELSPPALADQMAKCCDFAENLHFMGRRARDIAESDLLKNPSGIFASHIADVGKDSLFR